MAKLSKRQKFLRESSSSSGKRWQFNKEQLDQIESLYGANVRNIYEPEKTPPQQLSSKRKNFLSMTGRLSDYSAPRLERFGAARQCKIDVVVGIDVSGSVGYQEQTVPPIWAWLPWNQNSPLANAQNDFVSSLVSNFAPYMNSGDLQMGIYRFTSDFQWADDLDWPTFDNLQNPSAASGGYELMPTSSGKWLSDNPGELDVVAQNITGTGEEDYVTAINAAEEMLDKAQTDTSNCSLGNRNGQIDFKRVIIILTDAVGNFAKPTVAALAETVWPTSDIYAVKVQAGFGNMSSSQQQLKRESLQAMCGTSGSPTSFPWATNASGQMIGLGTGGEYDMAFAGNMPQLSGIASIIKSKVCPPDSWNCDSGYDDGIWQNTGCNDPGNGSGQHSTLAACQAVCNPPNTWDCDGPPNYNCYDPGTGNGQYQSYTVQNGPNSILIYSGLMQCNQDCYPPSWDCDDNYNCYDPGTGNGQYTTLQDCENDCIAPSWDCGYGTGCYQTQLSPYFQGQYSSLWQCEQNCSVWVWECTSAGCNQTSQLLTSVSTTHPVTGQIVYTLGPNQYISPFACQADCVASTFNCTPNGCVDPGDGTGSYTGINSYSDCADFCMHYSCVSLSQSATQCLTHVGMPDPFPPYLYTTLADCQRSCVPETWNCIVDAPPNGIPTYNCVDPGNGTGQYFTLSDCQRNCGPQLPKQSWDCDELLGCYDPGTGSGQHPTFAACQAACFGIGVKPSWDCSPNYPYQCYDPGTGLGQYSTLAACQAVCGPPTPPPIDTETSTPKEPGGIGY